MKNFFKLKALQRNQLLSFLIAAVMIGVMFLITFVLLSPLYATYSNSYLSDYITLQTWRYWWLLFVLISALALCGCCWATYLSLKYPHKYGGKHRGKWSRRFSLGLSLICVWVLYALLYAWPMSTMIPDLIAKDTIVTYTGTCSINTYETRTSRSRRRIVTEVRLPGNPKGISIDRTQADRISNTRIGSVTPCLGNPKITYLRYSLLVVEVNPDPRFRR